MAVPTLGHEQYQYDDTGILLNGDASLPFVDIESIQGLDSADIRQSTATREDTHGGYVDAYWQDIRTVTIEGTIYATPTTLEDYLDDLKANFAPTQTDKPLYFETDVGTRLVFGKSLGLKYSKDAARRLGKANFQVQIICQDPRIYGAVLNSATITRAAGVMHINNTGNKPTTGIFTITGPISSPTITDDVSGTTFSFPGYSLSTGATLSINLDNRAVLQSTNNIRNKMSLIGNWYEITPGSHSFTFGGSGSTSGTTLNLQYRAAWE